MKPFSMKPECDEREENVEMTHPVTENVDGRQSCFTEGEPQI